MKKKSGEMLSERRQISPQVFAENVSKQPGGKVLHLGELLLERSLIAKEQLTSAEIERCYGHSDPSPEAAESLPECAKGPEPGAGIVFISTVARQASREAKQETPEPAHSPEPAVRIVSEMVSVAFRVGASARAWSRFCSLKNLSLTYEGRGDTVAVHPPDISPKGMFINTTAHFPEGSVLKLSFRLARSNRRVETRCEVRYCVPGLGVGVEFIVIAPSDRKAIGDEIQPIKKKLHRRR